MTNGNVIHTNFFLISLKFHNGVRIFQELTLSDINIDWEKKYTITHPFNYCKYYITENDYK